MQDPPPKVRAPWSDITEEERVRQAQERLKREHTEEHPWQDRIDATPDVLRGQVMEDPTAVAEATHASPADFLGEEPDQDVKGPRTWPPSQDDPKASTCFALLFVGALLVGKLVAYGCSPR